MPLPLLTLRSLRGVVASVPVGVREGGQMGEQTPSLDAMKKGHGLHHGPVVHSRLAPVMPKESGNPGKSGRAGR